MFLTATRVYKLRKPVSPGFLDFGLRAARNDDCERELRLNRRLAPDVYLASHRSSAKRAASARERSATTRAGTRSTWW